MSTPGSKENKVLAKMLDRLFAGLLSGPGMNCRPHKSRQRVDLTQLEKLQDISPEQLLRDLLGKDGHAKTIARVKQPRANENPAEGEAEESSPKEKAWDDQTALLNKLRLAADDARTYEQDTGVHVLNLGFPLLSLPPGSFATGARNASKRILAPIAFIPVTLTLKRGTSPSVELGCRGESVDRILPNTALLAWLEQQTGQLHSSEIFADEEGTDPWREICELVSHVAKALNLPLPGEFSTAPPPPPPVVNHATESEPHGLPIPLESLQVQPAGIPESLKLQPAPRAETDSNSPAILCSAVLGLFPVAKQGLLRDTQAMLVQSAENSLRLTGPVESFLNAGIDFDESSAPLFDTQPKPLEQSPRELTTDRLATAADPCQARAVALAREARGLVIHGPPGTGKSQTITNVIADHLSRGQRVLLVCDKRTALDVVADRLEHMGLGNLFGIVHDPQRDQRDLYKSIREQLEALPETKTSATAEGRLLKVDEELLQLHGELSRYHHSLMAPPAGTPDSFHELMGKWFSLQPADEVQLAGADAISPAEFDQHEASLRDLLRRAAAVDFNRNPWAQCAGIGLNDYLARPMQTVRIALDRCLAAAGAADETIDPAIPRFSGDASLHLQGTARAELADQLESLLANISPAALQRWATQSAPNIRSARQSLESLKASVEVFRSGALDADLRAVADPLPSPLQIAQQLRSLDSYLETAGKWYAVFSFGTKSDVTRVLKVYGLPTLASEAARLKKFLIGLRARLAIQQVRAELSEAASSLAADDVLNRFLTQHGELFDVLIRLHEDPALTGILAAAGPMTNQAAMQAPIVGLRQSPARAEALAQLEDALAGLALLNPQWLGMQGDKHRNGFAGAETVGALIDRLETLEGVLRVDQGLAAFPKPLAKAARQLVEQAIDPASAMDSLRKAVLAGEIQRRLGSDSTLLGTDAHHVESQFEKYRTLDAKKKELVRDAIQHRWVSKQKDRLLVRTGTKLNSAGAEVGRRLIMRGERAVRLRQVIALGEKIEGGDPLFDLCPVWMASPETVAQIFPRQPMFDVVVFDEASQCRLEEALPVLTRGHRVVIAGDPKQLPPTRFFESAFTQSEDEEPENEQELFETQQGEVEDLLAAALNLAIQHCYLDVHYRSRNSDLIEFSNRNFYNRRLQAIPGHPSRRSKTPPVNLHRVDGVYANRKNEAEADRIVQIVRELLETDEPPSIGIACFNLQQRDLVMEKLDDLAGEDPAFAKALTAARNRKGQGSFDGLFVKNLENVQGDERDHIIISTTYGPDSRGKFYRRFGPLGRAGGGRRLNVLVTRAREQVHVVTSIPADAYRNLPAVPEGQTPGGAWLLFAYLKYAEELATLYPLPGQNPGGAIALVEAVNVHSSASASLFAQSLGLWLMKQKRLGSDVQWGNEGFLVDLALHDPNRTGEVTIGVLCDSCRYAGAIDSVEWDIFRTGILAGQGWKLHRLWTPHFFRDPDGNVDAILKAAGKFAEKDQPAMNGDGIL